ncbi:MaoC/PaaZ C-terminal domain-containing protein [Phycicoccus endophyticus]|uniref:MaoC/PaaZ C-terminal domain-containing protein n=1 Tax=Phycicoccus endophyticus TaxID=1690220 RepID=UPI0030B80595
MRRDERPQPRLGGGRGRRRPGHRAGHPGDPRGLRERLGDQNPIHQDEEFARSVGLPDVIAHGMWTMGAAGTVVSEWAGDAGRVVEYGTRFTQPVVVPASGGEVVVSGTVRAVEAETGRVTVDLTATSEGRKVLGRCVAVVRLDVDG